jgi:hypothetical protein
MERYALPDVMAIAARLVVQLLGILRIDERMPVSGDSGAIIWVLAHTPSFNMYWNSSGR